MAFFLGICVPFSTPDDLHEVLFRRKAVGHQRVYFALAEVLRFVASKSTELTLHFANISFTVYRHYLKNEFGDLYIFLF